MGARWRRPFCTSIRRDPEATTEKRSLNPRICAKFGGLFSGGGAGSNPSTPRLQAISNPGLRCRTSPSSPKKMASAAVARPCTPPPLSSATNDAGMRRNPTRLFQASSERSSPRSPSKFALFKASLRLSRSRCGLCAQSVKAGDGTAVFTAECSHSFHLACIGQSAASTSLVCPLCSATWRNTPLLSSVLNGPPPSAAAQMDDGRRAAERLAAAAEHRKSQQKQYRRTDKDSKGREREGEPKPTAATKVYDDDEPLLISSTSRGGAVRFNPIPEADDEDDDEAGHRLDNGGAFQGLCPPDRYPPSSPSSESTAEEAEVHHHHPSSAVNAADTGGVEVIVMPEAAQVSASRSHRNYVIALQVKAPPPMAAAPLLDPSRRAPIDLVTVLDVRGSMTGAKLYMLKRAMRQLISSLAPGDRLSIVAFSSTATKRLLPLHRMSREGQRSARQIVDRLIVSSSTQGHDTCGGGAGDALRKAAKVLEDRRERNPVATIMLLSDGQQQQLKAHNIETDLCGTTTGDHRAKRFAHVNIPIHASGLGDASQPQKQGCLSPMENPFTQCVLGGLLLHDVHLQFVFPAGEISSAYSCGGTEWAVALGGGSTVRLGDLHAGAERELLLELRVPAAAVDGGDPHQHAMSVKCSYWDAVTQEVIRCQEQTLRMPPLKGSSHPQLLRSPSSLNAQRLRNLFVATRAMAESRRLADLNDLATAVHLLSSARSLLLQCTSISSDKNLVLRLEAELADLQRLRQQQQSHSPSGRSREQALLSSAAVDDGREALTPSSAWRAAERLAKLAIMRKSLNRVSDLHGFENARF